MNLTIKERRKQYLEIFSEIELNEWKNLEDNIHFEYVLRTLPGLPEFWCVSRDKELVSLIKKLLSGTCYSSANKHLIYSHPVDLRPSELSTSLVPSTYLDSSKLAIFEPVALDSVKNAIRYAISNIDQYHTYPWPFDLALNSKNDDSIITDLFSIY